MKSSKKKQHIFIPNLNLDKGLKSICEFIPLRFTHENVTWVKDDIILVAYLLERVMGYVCRDTNGTRWQCLQSNIAHVINTY